MIASSRMRSENGTGIVDRFVGRRQNGGDDEEAEGEPAAQGHVESEQVVERNNARTSPDRPFATVQRPCSIGGSAPEMPRAHTQCGKPLGILGVAQSPRH